MDVLQQALSYVQTLAVSVLVGKVVLLSFVIAPILARTLDPGPFGSVVRAMFPAYYALGMASAAVGICSLAVLALAFGGDNTLVAALGLWLAVLAIEWYCRTPLTPALNSLRDRLKEQEDRGQIEQAVKTKWDRLHRRSVQLNSAVLVIGLCLVGLL